MEDSPSGLWRSLGKRVGLTPSRVRISHPPPNPTASYEAVGFFISSEANPKADAFSDYRHSSVIVLHNTPEYLLPQCLEGETQESF